MQENVCDICGLPGLCKCRQLSGHKKDIKHSRERSQNQERTIAQDYKKAGYPKAHKIIMSGGIATMKGDISVEDFLLVEAKESRQGSLRIDPNWVRKISKEAKDAGKQWWALHAWVASEEDNYSKVVLISEHLWFNILSQLKRNDETS